MKPYIVFYIQLDDGIEIVRILHQSRDIARLFSE
ncbi:type II toxin-antitoxin system RelE/ParE family toxin [Scytonema hofmannii FACHB-248]|uniref:Type II toxin-antitoxin system RelE/ParE family toxin n=1 Tax=Scytonema hofmannii FACHB-248 TaxID=1842502 RepID=A0ABR8GZA8_9CYAN|nr:MULTISPECIES: type II toxin-antitoxin system RelE/ParE family toxin [Nostocales]MBD2608584.1 type II toxin-antitoxin system RelE/ParE family toxin [Scytonema hofmannii FACHB-248]